MNSQPKPRRYWLFIAARIGTINFLQEQSLVAPGRLATLQRKAKYERVYMQHKLGSMFFFKIQSCVAREVVASEITWEQGEYD